MSSLISKPVIIEVTLDSSSLVWPENNDRSNWPSEKSNLKCFCKKKTNRDFHLAIPLSNVVQEVDYPKHSLKNFINLWIIN